MLNKIYFLLKFMRGYKKKYFFAIFSLGFSAIFAYSAPIIIKISIDSLTGEEISSLPGFLMDLIPSNYLQKEFILKNLHIPALLFLLFTVMRGLFLYVKGKWAGISAEITAKRIRDKLFDHIIHLPYKYHAKAETGDLIQRCTSDVETIRKFIAIQFVEVGGTICMVAIALFIMFSLSVQMTLISTIAVPIVFLFAIVFFTKVKKAFKASDEADAELTTVLQENLSGIRVVRAFARQNYEIDKFDMKNGKYRDLTYRLIKLIAWYWAFTTLVAFLQIAFVLIAGVFLVLAGKITLGILFAFLTYVGLLLWPVRQMGRILTDMGKAFVAIDRIKMILDEPSEKYEEGVKKEIEGDIEFKNVFFSYEKGLDVLKDISFTAKKGETIAILGRSGSGKSTLVKLLPRLYDYQKGSIKIDGVELSQFDKRWIRDQIAIVLQEPFLFSKTIRDNIAISDPMFKDREIVDAASIAALDTVIDNFSEGYETVVGEDGVTLSGGQKQRVAIARSVIRKSKILIFDDSLSAVDTETDAQIRKALNERSKDITTIIISHRITTLQNADRILVLKEGEIKENGTHDELLKIEGLYKRIWDIQTELENDLFPDLEEELSDISTLENA